ncbi:NAD(P)/FAD-dependent oxidoreductase [Brucella tritici]|uniref:FAD/NAD(P)-dependent oxidoreductase n=1 Tax=Brucella tritici TaxID=94626 RepID=UPI001F20AD00|nr:FAD/NAD(P)-binding oxidoreductase [Brucella tritici]
MSLDSRRRAEALEPRTNARVFSMTARQFDLPPVIIGAGPAGLAAAKAFVEAGIRPIILEETNNPGGQGTRRLHPSIESYGHTIFGRKYYEKALRRQNEEDTILNHCDYRPGTMAWAIYDNVVSTVSQRHQQEIPYQQLLIAIGATDRILAVEGWQLGGVYSLGGAQVALKTHASSIGKKIVFAGSSPLLYLAAAQYVRLGFRDVTILDTTTQHAKYKAAFHMARYSLKTLFEGVSLINELKSCGVKIFNGVRLTRFEGNGHVEAVVYADQNGTTQRLECDAIGFGFGLKPETQLAELAGAKIEFDPHFRQWLPLISNDGQARDDLWLAGDCVAIGGAEAADASGRLAALTMLKQMGKPTDQREFQSLAKKVSRLRNFQRAMASAFRWPHENAALLSDQTYVCRCERVTVGEIRKTVEADIAHTEVNRIKAITRCGMGRCQGRYCNQTLQELAVCSSGKSPEATGRLRAQAPFRPMPVGVSESFLNKQEQENG